jgi:hypothetical protein
MPVVPPIEVGKSVGQNRRQIHPDFPKISAILAELTDKSFNLVEFFARPMEHGYD